MYLNLFGNLVVPDGNCRRIDGNRWGIDLIRGSHPP